MPIVWSTFAKQWLKRAERRDVVVDDADRFVCLWIAFNGWMKSQYGEASTEDRLIDCAKQDTGLFQYFKQLQENDNEFKENLDSLSVFPIADLRYVGDVQQPENAPIQYDGSYDSLIDALYRVRRNLFLGNKYPVEDAKDKALVSLTYDILYPLFKGYFKSSSYAF